MSLESLLWCHGALQRSLAASHLHLHLLFSLLICWKMRQVLFLGPTLLYTERFSVTGAEPETELFSFMFFLSFISFFNSVLAHVMHYAINIISMYAYVMCYALYLCHLSM
jgi:hypothetical protein